jgi:hypothetical protein
MKKKFEITAEEILKDEEERGKELRRLRSEVDTFRWSLKKFLVMKSLHD